MNVESTESNTEIPGEARDDSDANPIDDLELTDAANVGHCHDIQASLAIINGFSHALQSSFDELKNRYGDVLEQQQNGESGSTSSDRLMSLEADCRFCLSRLCSSIDQLKQRLESVGVLRDSKLD